MPAGGGFAPWTSPGWYRGGTFARMGMQLRLSDSDDKFLEQMAAQEGKSKNQLVADLVRQEWQRRQTRTYTHSILDQLASERADLMRRLAQ